VLIGYQAPRILVITFPLLALLFSIFGMIVLYRGSRYFLQATYAISVIRNRLNLHAHLSKRDLKTFGIDDLLCDRFASAEEYVKKRSFNLTRFRIRTIIYWIYIVLAVMSMLLMGYLIFAYR
jgi:ABC-type multidrug transport system fused ATPase/permease subunit